LKDFWSAHSLALLHLRGIPHLPGKSQFDARKARVLQMKRESVRD
jgi:hypothetical protein